MPEFLKCLAFFDKTAWHISSIAFLITGRFFNVHSIDRNSGGSGYLVNYHFTLISKSQEKASKNLQDIEFHKGLSSQTFATWANVNHQILRQKGAYTLRFQKVCEKNAIIFLFGRMRQKIRPLLNKQSKACSTIRRPAVTLKFTKKYRLDQN